MTESFTMMVHSPGNVLMRDHSQATLVVVFHVCSYIKGNTKSVISTQNNRDRSEFDYLINTFVQKIHKRASIVITNLHGMWLEECL